MTPMSLLAFVVLAVARAKEGDGAEAETVADPAEEEQTPDERGVRRVDIPDAEEHGTDYKRQEKGGSHFAQHETQPPIPLTADY